ncbi:hypothetical protein [Enterococcus pallens]|uniref:DUF5648 domain-containing protein n=1 Tax=Enterococcus pallens ATCC BAA-351 TaxID=1158607 RepID=R2RSH1_9ENTE|nr:hypothetical protein [Enterococcus pallens]EOH86305.1 hypothetical protein UAU_05227 [Enterococcus pallens ATCC BAA-351]EOU09474.1 hypothetical protein I588_05207 [Enterococcus pallens ATCC BAA-351]OJG77530.1 hypothetical protein RV10_GL002364 [Enterococcus pallens]
MNGSSILGKVVVGLGILLGVGSVALANSTDADASTLYRAYNPNTGEHLYTQNYNEIPFVVKAGWRNEGIAWEAPSKGVPVYRMFNPNNGGDHHYTVNTNEVDMLKGKGWRYEGESWKSGGSIPVYRLYNPNAKSGTHHYTQLALEKDQLVKAGWRYEGIAFYSGSDASTQPTQPSKPQEPAKPTSPTIVSGWVGNTGKIFASNLEASEYGENECLKEGSIYSRYVVITIFYSDGSQKYSVSLYEN